MIEARCGFSAVIQELVPATPGKSATYQWAILRGEEIVDDGLSTGSREILEGWVKFLLTCWIAGTVRPLPVSIDTATEALAA